MSTTTQQTQTNVMDVIITDITAENFVFQKFGSIYDNRVIIASDIESKRTSLYVNLKRVDNTIQNITWAQLEKLQQEAFEIWLALQN